MGDKITFDYFYGGQEETFSYYRIPRVLFTGQQFKGLSIGAKMLYGLLLDRMYLSSRNGWYDDQGRVYIYYPVEEIEETMGCGHSKAVRLLAELDEVKGIGLIERIRQGLGKPAKIYVKQFTTRAVPDTPRGPAPDSTPQPTGFNRDRQDVSKKDLQGDGPLPGPGDPAQGGKPRCPGGGKGRFQSGAAPGQAHIRPSHGKEAHPSPGG